MNWDYFLKEFQKFLSVALTEREEKHLKTIIGKKGNLLQENLKNRF